MNENVEYVKKVLPKPVLFVQLAEECDELGQAALKIFRILDGRNPTPVPIGQAIEDLFEEIADILGVLRTLELTDGECAALYGEISANKFERWVGRLKEKYGEE